MISDPVARWKSRIGESSWETYAKWWKKFTELFQITDASELLKMNQQQADDLATEYYDRLKAAGYASTSCSGGYQTVRSFFSHNGVVLGKADSKFRPTVELEPRFTPTQKNVFDLIYAIPNARDKAVAGVCFQGGQRDGIASCLKLKHIVTPNWREAKIVIFDVPPFVPDMHGRNVNKWKAPYRFGVLDDVAGFIKLHLAEREAAGERLTAESWLFRTKSVGHRIRTDFGDSRIEPIKKCYVNQMIKFAAVKIGIQTHVQGKRSVRYALHAHVGRRYFKKMMRLSGVDPELRDFMMGHKVKYERAYDEYDEAEITNALEQARARLTLSPQPLNEVERQRQNFLDSARVMVSINAMTPERYAELEQSMLICKSTTELEAALDKFKNGKVTLEPIGR
jgi:hypothetical protein